jgi:hypothetical protein
LAGADAMSDESIFAAALSKAPGLERRAFLEEARGEEPGSRGNGARSDCGRLGSFDRVRF